MKSKGLFLSMFVLLFFYPLVALANITFTNGKWEGAFNCSSEWTGNTGSASCSGVNFWAWLHDTCTGTGGNRTVQIVNAANYSGGAGGMGMRQWYGSGKNNNSGGIGIEFPSAQSEVWMRWYQRADPGLVRGQAQGETKTLYFHSGSYQTALTFGLIGTDQWRFWAIGSNSNTYSSSSGYGWESLIKNNGWNAVEVYIKADTNGSNGILRAWVNGNRIINVTNADTSPTAAGWTSIAFPSNHEIFSNSACAPMDHDDVVIYNTTPPNVDANGNPMIGPIGWGGQTPIDTTPPVRSAGSPSGTLAAGTTQTNMTLTTNENATCRWSATSGMSYASMQNAFSTTGGTNHSSTLTGLQNGQSYNRYVRCIDGSGNANSNDFPISFSVASATAPPPSPSPPPPSSPVAGMPVKGHLLVSESFENNSWASRGWYDGTNSTGIALGGYSGNALRWQWNNGATNPTGFSTVRRSFPSTDEFLIEYWVKYDTGWRGSGRAYHPHLIHIQSTSDSTYQAPANAHGSIYFESLANTGSPFTNYPQVALQDSQRVNISQGSVPNNLTTVTETRSATQCNTPHQLSGGTRGDCYNAGGYFWSATTWQTNSVAIPANTWTKITGHIKKNTYTNNKGNFDGIMKLWVGDSLALSSNTVLFYANAYNSTEWNKIMLAPYMGDGSPISQTMWLDELSIWTVSSGEGPGIVAPPPLLQIVQ